MDRKKERKGEGNISLLISKSNVLSICKQARSPGTVQKRIANFGGLTDGTDGFEGTDKTDGIDRIDEMYVCM